MIQYWHFGASQREKKINPIMLKRVINDINVHLNDSFLQLDLDTKRPFTAAVSQDHKDSFPTEVFDVSQQNESHNQLQSLH